MKKKKETEAHKKDLENSNETVSSSPAMKTVTPIITSSGQSNGNVEVAARVPGVLEEGGACTLTLTKGSVTRTGSRQSMANVSEVSCGFIAIPRSSLESGVWAAKVSYASAKASGISEIKNITVQ